MNQHLPVIEQWFAARVGRMPRKFGKHGASHEGFSDGMEGVQWNAGVDRERQVVTVGVNLEGTKPGDWPIARFLERELGTTGLPTILRALPGGERAEVWLERDAWQQSRVPIKERHIGPEPPFSIAKLTDKVWYEMLTEALGCLDASRGYRGRGRQLVTLPHAGRQVKEVSPHLQVKCAVESAAVSPATLDEAWTLLRPVYEYLAEATALGDGKHARVARAEARPAWDDQLSNLAIKHYFEFLKKRFDGEGDEGRAQQAIPSRLLQALGGMAVLKRLQQISGALEAVGLVHLREFPPAEEPSSDVVSAVDTYLTIRGTEVFGGDPQFALPPFEMPAADLFVLPPSCSTHGDSVSRVAPVDNAVLDATKRNIGLRGEEFVLELEQRRLTEAGLPDLAGRVRWAARDSGDGLGYDIESFDVSGTPIAIEVKSTAHGRATPFLLTRRELEVAEERGSAFRLYRVFNLRVAPRLYQLPGPLSTCCDLRPQVFRAVPRTVLVDE